jgi:hypothetical protein
MILIHVRRGRDGAVSSEPGRRSTATARALWPHGAPPPRPPLHDARGRWRPTGGPDPAPRGPPTPPPRWSTTWRVWASTARPASAPAAGLRPAATAQTGQRAAGCSGDPAPPGSAPPAGHAHRPRLASRGRSPGRCAVRGPRPDASQPRAGTPSTHDRARRAATRRHPGPAAPARGAGAGAPHCPPGRAFHPRPPPASAGPKAPPSDPPCLPSARHHRPRPSPNTTGPVARGSGHGCERPPPRLIGHGVDDAPLHQRVGQPRQGPTRAPRGRGPAGEGEQEGCRLAIELALGSWPWAGLPGRFQPLRDNPLAETHDGGPPAGEGSGHGLLGRPLVSMPEARGAGQPAGGHPPLVEQRHQLGALVLGQGHDRSRRGPRSPLLLVQRN